MARARIYVRRVLQVVLALALLLPSASLAQPPSWTGEPGASTASSETLYRTMVTLAHAHDLARIRNLGVTVLTEGKGSTVVLADEVQLEALARLRFEPRGTDLLGALLASPQGRAAGLSTTLGSVAGAATAPLRLSSTQAAAVAALSSVDDDGDGLTNTQEGWWGTDALNSDSDGDGVSDGVEVAALKDWLENRRAGYPSTGRPFLGWPDELHDGDHDSVPDLAERWDLGLNANDESSDHDKFDDGQELFGITKWNWGALPRAEDISYISAEMPNWVKAPGNHPLVAAFPVPQVSVVPGTWTVTRVTTITHREGEMTETSRAYGSTVSHGASASVADTVTWNNWEEVSQAVETPLAPSGPL